MRGAKLDDQGWFLSQIDLEKWSWQDVFDEMLKSKMAFLVFLLSAEVHEKQYSTQNYHE